MNGRFSTAEGKLCRVLMRTSPGKIVWAWLSVNRMLFSELDH